MPKILIIDDNPDIIETLELFLKDVGYEVISASNGDKGLNLAIQEKPNLIILDAMMETADSGFQVARQLKGNPDYKNIPIIMLTAIKEQTGFDFKKEARNETWLPVDDYCDKPVILDELNVKIETLLKNK
jgi:CheY-like chemotaxis protein